MPWWEWESFGFSQVKKCLIWNFENYKKPVAAITDAVVACKLQEIERMSYGCSVKKYDI